MRKILLIDIPVVPVVLPKQARGIVTQKLMLESIVRKSLLPGVICPSIPYTRGLLQIAAALEEAGFSIDYVVWSDPKDRIRINEFARTADIVGITCMTVGHAIAASVATEVRSLNPNALIVLGGPHATALGPRLLEEIQALDAVVRGNGHSTMVDIGRANQSIDGIPGVCTRNSPEPLARTDPYSTAPQPAYNKLYRQLDRYAHSFRTYHGCPYRCTFCVEGMTWGQGSLQELDKLYEELNAVLRFLPKGTLVHFSDPVFNIDQDRTRALCTWLADHASHLYLSMDTRIDLLSPDRIASLRLGGFRYFRVGIESLVSDVLDEAQKDWLPNQVSESLRTLREVAPDVLVHAYWITGLPGTTHETGKRSVLDSQELIQKGLIDILSNKVLVPYPGSKYFSTPERFGLRLLNKPWKAYDRLSFPVYDLPEIGSDVIYGWFCDTERAASEALTQRVKSSLKPFVRDGLETYKSIAYMGGTRRLK